MDFYCDQVLTGQVPVERIADTENALAFHHTQPYWPVHIVIIPKRHIASLAALVFAITPTLRLSFSELRQGLGEGRRGSAGNTWRRLGSKLVVLELATN